MWCARYGIPEVLVSDQGAHFRNEVMKHLGAHLKVEQVFSPVYTPWLNGTVERLNKDFLQVSRHTRVPYLFPALQANLNHTPVQSLGGHAPVELFIGLPASSPLEVLDAKEAKRVQDMATHKGSTVNFDADDFVLWSRIDQRLPNNKLLGQWISPFKVIEAKPHTFAIHHLISGRQYEVHASRLKYYADADLNQTAELMESVASQGMLLGGDAICDHRFNQALQRWELLVSWMGLQAIENSWEPLTILSQDVPNKVLEYAMPSDDADLLEQVE
ncbi:hypothetical protein PHMEG_00016534 [Phytophthora megakarya]|uniref:Integrase catalytic domain-containing protein n=1 Tax=Phytophthora megakarya TaxID=4795 RepID=A0A225W0P4_9STRA|nr:hypothetical protein PHMEG_00016534 [Phytophthora megakarya]